MKNKDVIKALQKLDPEANVLVNIGQQNKVNGVIQLEIGRDNLKEEHVYFYIDGTYEGATINVMLPEGFFISSRKK